LNCQRNGNGGEQAGNIEAYHPLILRNIDIGEVLDKLRRIFDVMIGVANKRFQNIAEKFS